MAKVMEIIPLIRLHYIRLSHQTGAKGSLYWFDQMSNHIKETRVLRNCRRPLRTADLRVALG